MKEQRRERHMGVSEQDMVTGLNTLHIKLIINVVSSDAFRLYLEPNEGLHRGPLRICIIFQP
jgi:hypothetical protein